MVKLMGRFAECYLAELSCDRCEKGTVVPAELFSKQLEAREQGPAASASPARGLDAHLRVRRKPTMTSITNPPNARCVATTGDAFCKSIKECAAAKIAQPRRFGYGNGSESNFFREAQFSGDGTTIVTHNEDHCLRTFVLPTSLLDGSQQPHELAAYATGSSPGNVLSYATYPAFALQDSSTTLVLSATADQPIILRNALDYNTVHAKYPHVSPTTEEYMRSSTLAFTRDARHFVAGSKNQIATFDCAHNGSGPLATHRTGVSQKARRQFGAGSSMGCKGIVSGLSISGDGVLAVGTTEREIGLYSNEGNGECITAFTLTGRTNETELVNDGHSIEGTGITGLKWSPCGRYVIIAERQCDAVQIYDVRNTLQWVSRLTGRKAETAQKLGINVVPTAGGYEVWAGGTDGYVRMWNNPGSKTGEHAPDAGIKLHDGEKPSQSDSTTRGADINPDPVSSAVWHPSGAVLATSSGQRCARTGFDDSSSSESDEGSASDSDSGSGITAEKHTRTPDNKLSVWLL